MALEIRILRAGDEHILDNVADGVFDGNRGYATRVLTLLCDSAARLPHIQKIEAHIDADNIAARRVAEKAGFVATGIVGVESWAGTISPRVLYVRPVIQA